MITLNLIRFFRWAFFVCSNHVTLFQIFTEFSKKIFNSLHGDITVVLYTSNLIIQCFCVKCDAVKNEYFICMSRVPYSKIIYLQLLLIILITVYFSKTIYKIGAQFFFH